MIIEIVVIIAVSLAAAWYIAWSIKRAVRTEVEPIRKALTDLPLPVVTENFLNNEVPLQVLQNLKKTFDTRNIITPVLSTEVAVADMSKDYTRELINTVWHFKAPYIDTRDLWIGIYYNLHDDANAFTTIDVLDIYICLLPTIVIKLKRNRYYNLIYTPDKVTI